jgi:sRNA-binding carbon storage regulator CsrA
MLVLSLQVDDSIVFGDELLLTLKDVGTGYATVITSELTASQKGVTRYLPKDEPVSLSPEVVVVFLQAKFARPGARLGLNAPRDMPVYRKEVIEENR